MKKLFEREQKDIRIDLLLNHFAMIYHIDIITFTYDLCIFSLHTLSVYRST